MILNDQFLLQIMINDQNLDKNSISFIILSKNFKIGQIFGLNVYLRSKMTYF
jgi:hypothetical protein